MTQIDSDSLIVQIPNVQTTPLLSPEQHAALIAEILAKTLVTQRHLDATERTFFNRIESVERKTCTQLDYVERKAQAQLKNFEQSTRDLLYVLDRKMLTRWDIVDPFQSRLFVIWLALVFIISCLLIK